MLKKLDRGLVFSNFCNKFELEKLLDSPFTCISKETYRYLIIDIIDIKWFPLDNSILKKTKWNSKPRFENGWRKNVFKNQNNQCKLGLLTRLFMGNVSIKLNKSFSKKTELPWILKKSLKIFIAFKLTTYS